MTIGFDRPGTAKSSIKPTPKLLAWAAGFLEGEGYFGWKFRDNPRHTPTFRLSAVQVQKEPLEVLLKLFGGRLKAKPAHGNSQACFVWEAHGSRGLGIALTLFQFLSTKRKAQIAEGLPYVRVGHGNKDMCVHGHSLTDANAVWEKRGNAHVRKCRDCRNRMWRNWYHKNTHS